MPILDAETSLFPDDLFQSKPASVPNRCWWVAYTMARQEKALARQLLRWEIPFFLPMVAKNNCVRGRRICSYVPLFSGYVFLFARQDERAQALSTSRISSLLEVLDQEQLYRDLQQVHHLTESKVPITIEPRLLPGSRVRVKEGAMMGLEGTVVSQHGRCRVLIAVNFLQQGASVAIEDHLLEPLS
jgi:transcription antitermination factor NusG